MFCNDVNIIQQTPNVVHVSHNMIMSKVPQVMQHPKCMFLPFIVGMKV